MKRVIRVNGPEPTGFGFVNVAGSPTFDQMCCGITITPLSVDAMNWVDYPAPVAEFRARLRGARDVWLLDTPEIFNALGAAPRNELVAQGFARVASSRNDLSVLEHWSRVSS